MRILVTGGTGFLGGFLVRRLVAEGHRPRVLVRSTSRVEELEALGAELIQGGLADEASVERAVSGVDIVYHCAAQVEASGSKAEFFEFNVKGTERVLKACLRAGVARAVYMSSLGVYGLRQEDHCVNEDTTYDEAPHLRGDYSHSKLLADKLAMAFSEKTGLPVALLRPGLIYGPGKELPVGLFGFQRGDLCLVVGRADCLVPLNYVENTVDALLLAARLDKAGPSQFNLVDDEELTLGEYYQARARIGGTRALFLPGWPFYVAVPLARGLGRLLSARKLASLSAHQIKHALQSVRYDTTRIRQGLGWEARVSLEEALKRTLRPEAVPGGKGQTDRQPRMGSTSE